MARRNLFPRGEHLRFDGSAIVSTRNTADDILPNTPLYVLGSIAMIRRRDVA